MQINPKVCLQPLEVLVMTRAEMDDSSSEDSESSSDDSESTSDDGEQSEASVIEMLDEASEDSGDGAFENPADPDLAVEKTGE